VRSATYDIGPARDGR